MEPFARAVQELKEGLPEVQAIYLFGSAATGESRAASDIDLAVLTPRPIAAVSRWKLQENVAALLHRDVDLVDLRTASTVMRVEVLRSARLLYDAAPTERALFEATALGAYARLNDERRHILEQARQSGTIHG